MDPESEGHPEKSIARITQKLIEILLEYDVTYVPLEPRDLQIVYDIFLGKILDLGNTGAYSGDVLNYIGVYFEYVQKYPDVAKKYYLKAIDKGNSYAMNNYGLLLRKEENIPEAKKYYLMAIDKGNSRAMVNYAHISQNTSEIKKYYLMAIDKGEVIAMRNYAEILESQGNISEAKKYLIMAIEKGDVFALIQIQEMFIHDYCKANCCDINEDFYDFLRIAYNNPILKGRLCKMFSHLAEIYVSGLECIDLHIQYSPDGSGAKQAKKDFTDRLVHLKDHTKDHK